MSVSPKAVAYEHEPFETIFLARREEILRLVNITSYSIRAMEGAARLSKVLNHSDDEVEHVQKLEMIALEEAKADFPLLHSAATVLIWGALEAAVRDFIIRWLVKYSAARQVPELARLRVSVGDYESLEIEARMRYLFGVLEREKGAGLKPGAGRFDCLMKPFGIDPRLDADLRRDLNEMAAVRNVIVHRAGIVDERFVSLCPWCKYKPGDHVRIGKAEFFRFLNSASHYAASIVQASRIAAAAMTETPSDA